jgi:hypothetical protein
MVVKKLAQPSRLHYFRGVRPVSLRRFNSVLAVSVLQALAVGLIAAAAFAQYPGQITKKAQDTPTLRAVGVVEWTGDPGKPKTSRLVPITVYDGQALQDGGVYLARPQPMALDAQVEYILEENGKPIGLYDIRNAGQEQGSWVGFGAWKPMPVPKKAAPKPIDDTGFDPNDDKPVLHRRHGSDSGSSDSGSPGTPPDPDRPTLHKNPDDSSNKKPGDSGGSDTSTGSGTSSSDPDRPTLHKPDSGDSNGPVLHKHTEASADAADGEHSGAADPDRPVLKRGKSTFSGAEVLPSLMGLPADMSQAVAVSDSKTRPEHPWTFTWANPADEDKMKEQMEDIARDALGLKTPPPAPAAAKKRTTTTAKTHAKPTPPPEPAPLMDEKFRVFELAYGSGATMVLSAHTDGTPAEQKFVTLIAQPDLYGNVLVLFKNVTDNAHLDERPRMRLIDAVDALADNRGELLFELRGATQRQFALFRVLRGSAEKIFVTGGGEYGSPAGE